MSATFRYVENALAAKQVLTLEEITNLTKEGGKPAETLIEIGCGTGRNLVKLGHLFAEIMSSHDLSRLDVAFFNLNGYVSVVFFVATLADVLLRK